MGDSSANCAGAYQATLAIFAIPDISACELVADSPQPMVLRYKARAKLIASLARVWRLTDRKLIKRQSTAQ
jgi:hypothetical protein